MRGRWLFITLGGGAVLTVTLALLDVNVGPPTGFWSVVAWPAELLLRATRPDVPLPNGKYEWTPLQDFSVWLGLGIAWAFWTGLARLAWVRARR